MASKKSGLVIDDNVEFSKGLQLALRREYAIDCAEDAFTANKLISSHSYDVILCDVRMPYLGGLDLAEQLNKKLVYTPIIFVTGDASPEVTKRAFELGAANIIQKPCELDELLSKMSTAISLNHRPDNDATYHELGYIYNLLKFHYYDINEILHQIQYYNIPLEAVKAELDKKQRMGRCHLDDVDSIKFLTKAA